MRSRRSFSPHGEPSPIRKRSALLARCLLVLALFAPSLAPSLGQDVPEASVTWNGRNGQGVATNRNSSTPLNRGPSPGNGAARPNGPTTPAKGEPLTNGTPLAQGLDSGYYVSQVGGVAFDGVARPVATLKVDDIAPTYNRTAKDGQRLRIKLNGRVVPTNVLYDWQLVPIAHFADSRYYAAVTLFGKLQGGAQPAQGWYVLNYHPALEDTLLGLRIAQIDMLLLNGDIAGELPRMGGRPLLGAGENPSAVSEIQRATRRKAYNNIFGSLSPVPKFQSYVVCDHRQQIEFELRGRSLRISGEPYYHFWKRGEAKMEQFRKGGAIVHVNSFNPLPITSLSHHITANQIWLYRTNPEVYHSTRVTMRFAALFRYIKQRNPAGWSAFLQDLEKVKLTPAVPTPALYHYFPYQRGSRP